jgi:branched-chain amino acid transport system permease protein
MWSLLLMQAIASGIVTGCVYALVALSLVIIYKSTDVVNFAGGELVMLGAYAGLLGFVFFELNYALMFALAVVTLFVVGALFERIALNTITGKLYSSDPADLVPLVVATVGFGFMLKGLVRAVPYTEEVRRLPPLLSGPPIFVGDVILQRQDIAIIGVAIAVMLSLTAFFNLTKTGRALRATSQNPRAAALIGIPVRRMRMAAWGLAAGIAAVAGVLLAPKLLMTPDMGVVVMLAFAAAIVGGFTSLPGCVIGGIVLGIVQNFVGIAISPQAISVTPFFVIIVVLLLRPQGLFGEAIASKKV